jgi:hypothetical protein
MNSHKWVWNSRSLHISEIFSTSLVVPIFRNKLKMEKIYQYLCSTTEELKAIWVDEQIKVIPFRFDDSLFDSSCICERHLISFVQKCIHEAVRIRCARCVTWRCTSHGWASLRAVWQLGANDRLVVRQHNGKPLDQLDINLEFQQVRPSWHLAVFCWSFVSVIWYHDTSSYRCG